MRPSPSSLVRMQRSIGTSLVCGLVALISSAHRIEAAPKVILISLDGATPRFVNKYLANGAIPPDQGIGLLKRKGVHAERNITVSPSLTAVGHIAIATGSTAAHNDIAANTFHLVVSPFLTTVSGFGAPIGGYQVNGPAMTDTPTAEPIWIALRAAGKKVVCATFPGADGLNVVVPGAANGAIVQPAEERTVDYTVPFGESSGVFEKGFTLVATDFGAAPQSTIDQLTQAGVKFFQVKQKITPLDSFFLSGPGGNPKVNYAIQVAALDTTNNGSFDTLVFFDTTNGIKPGPFQLPSTGPAYVKASDQRSSRFYLEGSPRKSGTGFYVSLLAPDLSNVHIARYSITDIPRMVSPQVLANVDDINTHVGTWGAQPDFFITERLTPSFGPFSDLELEAIYEDQVATWTEYQTNVALRAISQNPDADLVMVYSEQPDGSEHQFLLTDPRQASDPKNPATIFGNQDQSKVARYAAYVQNAYQAGNHLVQSVIDSVGVDGQGRPNSDIFVVSDHGFEIFHTTVLLNNLLLNAGIDPTQARAITSGPAANIYINLQNREPNGTVSATDYIALQQKIVSLLQNFQDTNPLYTNGAAKVSVFDKIYARPIPADTSDPTFGRRVSPQVGQDFGDVFALLTVGYNFDGAQTPLVTRSGDQTSPTPVLTVSNFYGAHGFDPTLRNLSAVFYAAGPDINHRDEPLEVVHNVDVAPTIARILRVTPSSLVQGKALHLGHAPLQLVRGVSRKVHGEAGQFDIPLALDGTVTVECRRQNLFLSHELVFTFSDTLTSGTASVAKGSGVSFTEISGDELVVHLWGVRDGETVNVTLDNVSNGKTVLAPRLVKVGFLFGDVLGSGLVDQSDVNEVRSDSLGGGRINSETFRADILLNGRVNQGDIFFDQLSVGHRLNGAN